MKAWALLIGIIVILAVLCSPVLAISKSDLISQYQTGRSSGFTPPTPTPTPIPTPQIPSWIVTPPPTPTFDRFNQGFASISVLSDPAGAVVYLDGKLIGITPVTISGLAAKSTFRSGSQQPHPYKIKLTKIGYQDYITTVTLTEGQTSTVSATLIPSEYTKREINSTKSIPTTASGTGIFWVTSTPTGASVYLDGVYKGITTVVITDVSSGSHNLNVTLGSIDYSIQVTYDSMYWLVGSSEVLYAPGPLHIHLSQQGIAVSDIERIPSKKPNIYLYSDRDLIAQVWLAPEEDITISEPVYQPGTGWQAEIRNGSLNGEGDFLFYEAMVPDSGWQKEEGYVIRAAYRGQDMALMLGPYGFNEKETSEFIEYWSQHLAEGVDYVFYPQETGAVARVMPLYISPEPDHVMRIWFYAEPLESAPEPVTSPEKIVRQGFYVIEWGVMIP